MFQEGLAWERHIFRSQPRWTKEPDIEIIQKIVQSHLLHTEDQSSQCKVEFLAQGAFNKLYKITSTAGSYVMRVSLPVDPKYKTLSEVSTLEFVRKNTNIPVAKVLAFSDEHSNELGFEWILMELMPGANLSSRWRKLSWPAKECLARRVAQFQAQLYRHRFKGIGNVYKDIKETARNPAAKSNFESGFCVDRIVSMIFFWEDHVEYNIPRGPFRSSKDWLDARLDLVIHDQDNVIARFEKKFKPQESVDQSSDDYYHSTTESIDGPADPDQVGEMTSTCDHSEDETECVSDDCDSVDSECLEEAEIIKATAARLGAIMDRVFPSDNTNLKALDITPEESTYEVTVLFHDDLNAQNILVDELGNITAVVDWEFVSAVPLWRACQLPQFLEGRDSFQCPDREDYGEATEDDASDEREAGRDPANLDGMNTLYWTALFEWEKTRLRQTFLQEMSRIEPRWIEDRKEGMAKAEFESAILSCGDGSCDTAINRWIDQFEKGKVWSLMALVDDPRMQFSGSSSDPNS